MSLARDVSTVGSATLASRLLAFFRDMGIAAVLGAGPFSDAFFAVLQFTNVFRRMLAEGALNGAFVPIWLRIKDESGGAAAWRFFWETLGIMTAALGALAAVGILFAPAVIDMLLPGFDAERAALATGYLRIMAPYVALAGIVALAGALLNVQGRVGAMATGVVAFNAVLLLALVWMVAAGMPAPSATSTLAAAVVAAGIVQLVITGAAVLHLPGPATKAQRSRVADTRRFFTLAGPGVLAAGIPQFKLLAGAMVASSSEAAVSWLYYANRLYELPLGVVSVIVATVMAPLIAASLRAGSTDAFGRAQARAFEIALGLALPAALALALLSHDIAGSLFERGAFGPADTAAVAAALAAISAGLPGHALEKAFGAVSYAHEDTRTPMLAALAGLATAIAGAVAFFPRYGHVGVAGAIGASGWIGAALLLVVLRRRGWIHVEATLPRHLALILAATVAMGLVLAGLKVLLAPLGLGASSLVGLAALAMLVAAGLAVYLAALQILGVARLKDLVAAALAPRP